MEPPWRGEGGGRGAGKGHGEGRRRRRGPHSWLSQLPEGSGHLWAAPRCLPTPSLCPESVSTGTAGCRGVVAAGSLPRGQRHPDTQERRHECPTARPPRVALPGTAQLPWQVAPRPSTHPACLQPSQALEPCGDQPLLTTTSTPPPPHPPTHARSPRTLTAPPQTHAHASSQRPFWGPRSPGGHAGEGRTVGLSAPSAPREGAAGCCPRAATSNPLLPAAPGRAGRPRGPGPLFLTPLQTPGGIPAAPQM